jgi:hypothetical protein
MNLLSPWALGPFELLIHAEGHYLKGEDLDRRLALISFDNAIEVAITTYLTLNPFLRGNRQYQNVDVAKWLHDYHSKLDFLDGELHNRGCTWVTARSHIVWAHDQRNEQYHGGNKGTPEKNTVTLIREAAIWVFSFLFEIPDTEARMAREIAGDQPPTPPARNLAYDRAIDRVYGMLDIGERTYYASEVLFATDYAAYREAGEQLCAQANSDSIE